MMLSTNLFLHVTAEPLLQTGLQWFQLWPGSFFSATHHHIWQYIYIFNSNIIHNLCCKMFCFFSCNNIHSLLQQQECNHIKCANVCIPYMDKPSQQRQVKTSVLHQTVLFLTVKKHICSTVSIHCYEVLPQMGVTPPPYITCASQPFIKKKFCISPPTAGASSWVLLVWQI